MMFPRSNYSNIVRVLFVLSTIVGCSGPTSKQHQSTNVSVKHDDGHEDDPETNSISENDNGILILKAQSSGKCLDISGSSLSEGGNVVQQTCGDNASQRWQFIALDSGDFQVVSDMTGNCLDAGDTSMDNAEAVQLAACNPKSVQQSWRIAEVDGYIQIEAAGSGKCLDVKANSLDDGASIITWECQSQPNQLWQKVVGGADKLDESVKPNKAIRTEQAPAISCTEPPQVTAELTEEWQKEVHGVNHQYGNFFTPLMHYNGSSYWVRNDVNHVPIVSKVTNGKVVTVKLAENYRARQNNHNLFSLGVDNDGYIHIVGDMQNGPNHRNELYPEEYKSAKILYWKSKKPESVQDGFEFLGNSPGAIPARSTNGIRFFKDNDGVLYSSAAVDAISFATGNWTGKRGIGLYRYDTTKKIWEAIGGKASQTPKSSPGDTVHTVLFWELGGEGGGIDNSWFQGLFHSFKFDRANRLHFATPVVTSATVTGGYDRLIYAVSDDGGYHWKKANGAAIAGLPIRGVDGHANQGHAIGPSSARYNWQVTLVTDKDDRPGIWALNELVSKDIWWAWDGKGWTDNNSVSKQQHVPHTGNRAPGGSMILTRNTAPLKVYCQETFSQSQADFTLEGYDGLLHIDDYGLRTTGSVYGIASNEQTGKQSLVKITYKAAP